MNRITILITITQSCSSITDHVGALTGKRDSKQMKIQWKNSRVVTIECCHEKCHDKFHDKCRTMF